MLFKKNQNIRSSSPPPPTDASRQEVASHLRMADKYIRDGRFEEAEEELNAVRAIETNNVYALALAERLQGLAATAKKKQENPVESIPELVTREEPKEGQEEEVAEKKTEEKTDTPKEPPKSQVDEAAIREEIQKKLEAEFNKKFTDEIRKAEQRIADALRKEREWQEAERASLIANLDKEKEKFKQEQEKIARQKIDTEVAKMEATFKQQLAAERKKAEEETRSEMSSLYEKSMLELKEAAVREKRGLLDKEQKAIEESKKQMQKEFEKQLNAEVEKLKNSSVVDHKKERDDLIESTRQRLEKEFQQKLDSDKRRIEEQTKKEREDLERSFEEQNKKVRLDTEAELERRLDEIRKNEKSEFDKKYEEARKRLESDFQAKLLSELAAEREKIEGRIEKELKARASVVEADRMKVVEEEQRKIDGTRSSMKAEMEKELERRVAEAKKTFQASYEEKLKLLGVKLPETREDKMRVYMSRLMEAWSDPPVTPEAARELMKLRDVLGLSFEDHFICEGEIRLQVYVSEIEKEIKKGKIKPNDESALEVLKRKYQISAEESTKLEPHVLAAFQRALTKATILVVDDEQNFLDTVKPVLEGYGYRVVTTLSPTEALNLLDSTAVDMIISDVMFSGTEGDGFSFYERVQKLPRLKKVPFIMMSGLAEGFFVRTGIQLGVDDYLTKPVDPDLLVAVVEGKLKKYRSLRDDD